MDRIPHPDQLVHVRIILGVVSGLALTRLLNGLARFVQHPRRQDIYAVHLGWVLFMFLAVIHFWWFEFGIAYVEHWSFLLYLFLILYASVFFLLCSMLFPDRMDEFAGFADYFHARQRWFYGLLALLIALDVIDSLAKGAAHLQSLGAGYAVRQGVLIAGAVAAMFARDRRFHRAFVALALLVQIVWIFLRYASLPQ